MKVIIEQNSNDLAQYIKHQTIINIEDINDQNIETLLKSEELVVIGVGSDISDLVSMMINSRPNEKKVITMVQQHPNLLVLLDADGANKIYE